jgi:hypothetical protein
MAHGSGHLADIKTFIGPDCTGWGLQALTLLRKRSLALLHHFGTDIGRRSRSLLLIASLFVAPRSVATTETSTETA